MSSFRQCHVLGVRRGESKGRGKLDKIQPCPASLWQPMAESKRGFIDKMTKLGDAVSLYIEVASAKVVKPLLGECKWGCKKDVPEAVDALMSGAISERKKLEKILYALATFNVSLVKASDKALSIGSTSYR